MEAASPTSAISCSGLTADSLPNASTPSFQMLCRVVGSKWGAVSADILFTLRRGMNEEDQLASVAFNQLFSAVDVPEVAELITAAASKHASFGSLATADKATADVRPSCQRVVLSSSGPPVKCHGTLFCITRCIRTCIGNCCIALYNARNRPIQLTRLVPRTCRVYSV